MKVITQNTMSDDPDFIGLLNHFIARVVDKFHPPELLLIKVDNWFDHKWLGFAGKASVSVEGLGAIDSEIRPFWRDGKDVTFAPFSPNRIIDQDHFVLDEGKFRRCEDARFVHDLKKRPSSANLERRVLDSWRNALFIWYSSASASNQRGSALWYWARDKRLVGWCVSFLRKEAWKVNLAKNIDREFLAKLFRDYYEEHSA